MFEVLQYQRDDGRQPFIEWLQSIRDKQAQARVRIRVQRLKEGLFGDCESVGQGVLELRDHHGAGSGIYLGRHGLKLVILLCGGTKRTQPNDIKAAQEYWSDWKRRHA